MDTMEARLKCLDLAAGTFRDQTVGKDADGQSETILSAAKKWAEFVIGDKRIESATGAKKGADDPK